MMTSVERHQFLFGYLQEFATSMEQLELDRGFAKKEPESETVNVVDDDYMNSKHKKKRKRT